MGEAHANARRNEKDTAREVVYIGLLPGTVVWNRNICAGVLTVMVPTDIDMNRRYAEHQLSRYAEGKVPEDQWHEHTSPQHCSHKFSPLGRMMMTMDPYH